MNLQVLAVSIGAAQAWRSVPAETYNMKEYKDASNRLSIDLGNQDQHILVEIYAKRLVEEFGAVITQKTGGLDQLYWDFDLSGTKFVLHYDNFMGISIFVENGTNDDLLRKVAAKLLNE